MLELLCGSAAFAAGPIILHLGTTIGGSPAGGIQIAVWVCSTIVGHRALVSLFFLCSSFSGRGKLQVPDIAHWEETGEPAWVSPPLAAGIRRPVHPTHAGNGCLDPSSQDVAQVEALARATQLARGES